VESGFYAVHEKGVAEILEGKLSVVALPPMPRLLSKRFVSQFKRY